MKQIFACDYCGRTFTDYPLCEECEKKCKSRVENSVSFGARLLMLRELKQLSQCKLAFISGVNQGSICQYELNEVLPTIKLLEKLCKALEVTATELLGY
jgi:DNA-binding XRE family transcriptional regulator